MPRKMHLMAFMNASPIDHMVMRWTHPRDQVGYQFSEPEYWQDIARTVERGKFDAVFLADGLGAYDNYKGSVEPAVRHGIMFPVHDPLLVLPVMGGVTTRLGLAVTVSVTYYQPYLAVRKLSTLDHLTRGRVGWNVVTSFHAGEARNMGLADVLPHDERYERAEEYMEVCYKLWDSWEPGALIRDKETGIFADPSKVRRINHVGKYYQCAGPLAVLPSPQGRPVIVQAGSSGRGQDFAARHAECVFSIQLTPRAMRAYSDSIRARARKFGRNPEDLKVLFGIQVIVGETEEVARAKQQLVHSLVTLEAALTRMSAYWGIDLSQLDLDQPLEEMDVVGIQGMAEAFTTMHDRKLTVREAALIFGRSVGMPQVVGTPEQVADQLQYLLEEGGGNGFNISPVYNPGNYAEFVEMVVPVLQQRGLFRHDYAGKTLREHVMEY